MTEQEVLTALTQEYEKEYFLSGRIDMTLYETDCVFSGAC